MMKRLALLSLLAAAPAYAQYVDGLPVASSVGATDLLPVCQGGTAGIPGTCTTRRAPISLMLSGYSGLLHMTQPGSIQFDGSRTWSGSQTAIGNAELYSYTNQSGSTSGAPIAFHFFGVASDTVQAPNGAALMWVTLDTGAGITGLRQAVYGALSINGQPGDGSQYSAGQFSFQAAAPANASGNIGYGSNPTCGLNSAATGAWGCVGEEIDVAARTGTTPNQMTGLSIVTVQGHVSHGSNNLDTAVSIGNQTGTTTGWDYGLRFGGPGTAFPFVSSATLIYAYPSLSGLTIANGIDLHQLTFTGNAFSSTGFTVSGTGVISAPAYKVGATAGVTCAAGSVNLTTFAVFNGIVTHC